MKLNQIIKYIPILFLLVIINSCEKEKVTSRDYPRIKTFDITEITSSGVKFNAEIFYNNGISISDHGFVWGPSSKLALGGSSESVSLGNFDDTGDFSFKGIYGLEPETPLYVRAYLITEENTVYGNLIQFTSIGCDPPIINDYSPKSASILDTIIINGQNFSNRLNGNIVHFDEVTASVTEFSNEQIRVLVPTGLDSESSIISVSSSGHTLELSPSFNLLTPEFTDFSPKSASMGQTISITGSNIPISTSSPNEVWFGNKKAVIQSATKKELIVEVPNNINSASEILRVVSFPIDKEFTEKFQLAPPIINYFSPTSGGPYAHMTISGEGFHQISANNEVRIGGVLVNLSSSNTNTLAFILPADLGLSTGDYKVSVTIFGLTTEASGFFHYIAP